MQNKKFFFQHKTYIFAFPSYFFQVFHNLKNV